MSWRNDPATEKQLALIEQMYEDAGMNGAILPPPFRGKTKGEACDYISRHIGEIHYAAYNPHEDAGDRI